MASSTSPTVLREDATAAVHDRAKVVHLTVHPPYYNRLFVKTCRTLAAAGYRVVLVAPHERDETTDGIVVRAVPEPRSRPARFGLTSFRVYRRALAERAALYHFHDPALIPFGLLLRLTGRPVIYDVYEDYVTALDLVPYLPRGIGKIAGRLFGFFERMASHAFSIIIAERYYARKFARSTPVLNYPRLEGFAALETLRRSWPKDRIRLLYTGVLTFDRGALNLVSVLNRLGDEEAELVAVGRCWEEEAAAMQRAAAKPERLHLVGVGSTMMPFSCILERYRESWTAALALFQDTPHSREKEITKLFEYMAAGLPIVCSSFPVWRELVEGNGCGICVDPEDPEAAARAVRWLHAHPEEASRMGEAGRRAVAERYNWDKAAENLLGLYRCLLGESR
jgi:glycosyltransferase involved in cell wall biosynthesis